MIEPTPPPPADRHLAVDLHKHYLVIGGVNARQEVVLAPRRIDLDDWLGWAQTHLSPTDTLVVEATTNAWDFYDQTRPLVGRLQVANAGKIALIAKTRVKTDNIDVLKLARLSAANLIPEVWVPPVHVRELRRLFSHRRRLVKVSTLVKLNRLSTSALWAEPMPFLMQLPGLGLITALTVLAAIGDVTRFETAKKLVGYAGLGASVHDSGLTHRTGRITKTGRRDLRYAMVEAAWAAVQHHPYWKAELARLARRMDENKAVVAIARRLLVAIWHVLAERAADQHAQPEMVATKLMRWS